MKIVLLLLLAVALLDHTAEALVRGEQRKEDQPRGRELKGSMDSGGSGDDGDTDSDTDAIIDAITNAACFSAISTVQVENKGPVAMKDLQVGDRVLANAKDGFEPVYAFGHWEPEKEATFLRFFTEKGNSAPLELTGEHLVFVHGKTNPVRADSIQVGDVLQGAVLTAKVSKIGRVVRKGLYVPLTPSGTVVVDGMQASSYIALQKDAAEYIELQGGWQIMPFQDYVHLALSPFRLICQHVSPAACDKFDVHGMPYYISLTMKWNTWASHQHPLFYLAFLLVVVALTGACMVLEAAVGRLGVPPIVGVIVAATANAAMKQQGIYMRSHKKRSV